VLKSPSYILEGDFGLGYNYHRFFAGLQFKMSLQHFAQDNGVVTTDDKILTYQVFVGMRIKGLKKINSWLDEKGIN